MLSSFTVQNYLSFQQAVTLSFEPTSDRFMTEEYTIEVKPGVRLLKIGIIYGANASGKTNLIAALRTLRSLVCLSTEDKTKRVDVIPFLLDAHAREEVTRFDLSFYIEGVKYQLELSADKERIHHERLSFYPSNRAALLYDRSYDASQDLVEVQWGSYIGLSKKSCAAIEGNTIPNMSVMAAWSKSNVEVSRLHDVYRFFSDSLSFAATEAHSPAAYAQKMLREDHDGSVKAFAKTFLRASDFNISDIRLEKNKHRDTHEEGEEQQYIVFQHHTSQGDYPLPESMESAGTYQMLILSLLLYTALREHRIIIIDEIESSLHYELLSYFLRTFLASSQGASQMLLTTHDLNLLHEDYIRRDTIWFAEKDEHGASLLTRLSQYGLHKNASPYHAYRQNKLARLPFLGSQYLTLEG